MDYQLGINCIFHGHEHWDDSQPAPRNMHSMHETSVNMNAPTIAE